LSLVFSFFVADVVKVIALTFVSAALLPGFLSPRARALRAVLRLVSNALQALS
jgi:hypothetical protein